MSKSTFSGWSKLSIGVGYPITCYHHGNIRNFPGLGKSLQVMEWREAEESDIWKYFTKITQEYQEGKPIGMLK